MNEHITIWVRMVLENLESDNDSVFVYVDCENADGFTETVYINPSELLKGIIESDTAGMDGQIQGENKYKDKNPT